MPQSAVPALVQEPDPPEPVHVQSVAGHRVGCGCGRSWAQHGDLSCAAIDQIEARIAYANLPAWRRWTSRRPEGWRR